MADNNQLILTKGIALGDVGKDGKSFGISLDKAVARRQTHIANLERAQAELVKRKAPRGNRCAFTKKDTGVSSHEGKLHGTKCAIASRRRLEKFVLLE